ncbi:hypothetical protein DTO217A2_7997 [Paecilomyces variotii]|nr:hypothetical protein DTO217A2_7997 [Paecilomyces variotii]
MTGVPFLCLELATAQVICFGQADASYFSVDGFDRGYAQAWESDGNGDGGDGDGDGHEAKGFCFSYASKEEGSSESRPFVRVSGGGRDENLVGVLLLTQNRETPAVYGERRYREKGHGVFEAGRGQKGHHDEMVAVTVFVALTGSPRDGDVVWGHCVCPFLFREPYLDHGLFLDLRGLWRLSTDLSTADSFGTQPCNLL